MGFLNDLVRGAKTAKRVHDQVKRATAEQQVEVELTVEAEAITPDRSPQFDWATPEEYDPIPPLKLRRWGVFDGERAGSGGYGFEWPDGRWLYPANLGINRYKKTGAYYCELAGGRYHLDDLADPSFDPGQPLRLVAEPDNPHSEKGTAISVRNWSGDKVAGYVPTGVTHQVRKVSARGEFSVVSLSGTFDESDPDTGSGEIVRVFINFVMFQPGRIYGLDTLPICPPIAPPRDS